jgi:eukaryotic-like serine/threonine-protein kinase
LGCNPSRFSLKGGRKIPFRAGMVHSWGVVGYRLLEVVGSGTTGTVYAAEHVREGTPVIVKVMHSDLAAEADLSARFVAAARRAAQLTHPYIARVLSVGGSNAAHATGPYVVMERAPGRPLGDWLGNAPLPVEQACTLGVQLCQALGAAHEQGVLHRDLKPLNVLVDWRANQPLTLKVTDFGLSWEVFDAAQAHSEIRWTLGTPQYLAPEILVGQPAGPSADVYSIGALLYEALAGAPRIQTADEFGVLKAALGGHFVPLTERNPKLPEPLVRAVENALHPDPDRRIRTAEQLQRLLEPYAAEVPSTAELPRGAEPPLATMSNSSSRFPSILTASQMLDRAPRARRGELATEQLISPVFPKSPLAPQIDSPTTTELDGFDGYNSLSPKPTTTSLAAPEQGSRLDLLAVSAGFGLGAVLAWLTF